MARELDALLTEVRSMIGQVSDSESAAVALRFLMIAVRKLSTGIQQIVGPTEAVLVEAGVAHQLLDLGYGTEKLFEGLNEVEKEFIGPLERGTAKFSPEHGVCYLLNGLEFDDDVPDVDERSPLAFYCGTCREELSVHTCRDGLILVCWECCVEFGLLSPPLSESELLERIALALEDCEVFCVLERVCSTCNASLMVPVDVSVNGDGFAVGTQRQGSGQGVCGVGKTVAEAVELFLEQAGRVTVCPECREATGEELRNWLRVVQDWHPEEGSAGGVQQVVALVELLCRDSSEGMRRVLSRSREFHAFAAGQRDWLVKTGWDAVVCRYVVDEMRAWLTGQGFWCLECSRWVGLAETSRCPNCAWRPLGKEERGEP